MGQMGDDAVGRTVGRQNRRVFFTREKKQSLKKPDTSFLWYFFVFSRMLERIAKEQQCESAHMRAPSTMWRKLLLGQKEQKEM